MNHRIFSALLVTLTLTALSVVALKYKSNQRKSSIDHSQIHQLEHKSIEELVALFGKPDVDEQFNLRTGMKNYRANLFLTYPNFQTQDVFVREIIWVGHRTEIFFWYANANSRWVYVDSLKRNEGVEF